CRARPYHLATAPFKQGRASCRKKNRAARTEIKNPAVSGRWPRGRIPRRSVRDGWGGVAFLILQLERETESAAFTFATFHRNRAAHEFTEALGNSQAKPGA